MAHNLNVVNGKASLFFTGEKPWHGLGQEVEGALTAEEAIKAASLDWTVDEEPVYDGQSGVLEKYKLLRRSDTKHVLHIAKKTYHPIQNREAFKFFDEVVATGDAKYVTAGALGAGERIWILAELEKCEIFLPGTDDVVKPYLLLANAHDGTLALWLVPTAIRVVCQNTMTLSLNRRKEDGIRIRHHAGALNDSERIRRQLGLIRKGYDTFRDEITVLASKQIRSEALKSYYETLVPDNPDAENKTRTQNIRHELTNLFTSGRGNSLTGVAGTHWAAYNSVTEYVDHHRTIRGSNGDRGARRTASILFGSGARLKEKAYELSLEYAGVES